MVSIHLKLENTCDIHRLILTADPFLTFQHITNHGVSAHNIVMDLRNNL